MILVFKRMVCYLCNKGRLHAIDTEEKRLAQCVVCWNLRDNSEYDPITIERWAN